VLKISLLPLNPPQWGFSASNFVFLKEFFSDRLKFRNGLEGNCPLPSRSTTQLFTKVRHTDTSPGFRLRVVCHSYKLHRHEWSVRGHLYKHITQRCLLRISSEIESSECFVKNVAIFYYIVNNFTNRAPLIMNNLSMT